MYNGTNYGYNPYYQQRFNTMPSAPQVQPVQQIEQPVQTPISNNNNQFILGKKVTNIDEVRGMEIPLDGSTVYCPLADGSCIITKQLQMDGTSKMIVYKPTLEDKKDMPKYLTKTDLDDVLKDLDIESIEDLKNEIKDLKKQIKELKTGKKSKED